MSDERKRILNMLAEGKINVEEAERLLAALASSEDEPGESAPARRIPRYLRVLVDGGEKQVNVRVPVQLLRTGIKLTTLLPGDTKSKVDSALGESLNMDLSRLTDEELEEFLRSLSELTVDVNDGADTIRVFCE